ncbi:MAG: hypothetical protein IJH91_07740 [Mogibacterium sp.]|nr:hypothetical protein [Mogibacterium sp.]
MDNAEVAYDKYSYLSVINFMTGLKRQLELSLKFYSSVHAKRSDYSDYCLSASRKGRYLYYTKVNTKTQKRDYLGKSHLPEVSAIKEYRVSGEMLSAIQHNLNLMTLFLNGFLDISMDAISARLPMAYRMDSIAPVSDNRTGNSWKEKMLKKKATYPPYRPEGLIHRAIDGTLVRSKSEALIYNQLTLHNITFIYEMPMEIGGVLLHPDFTILCEDGTILLWEHQGRMDKEQYQKDHSNRLSLYISDNYVPGINLLLSYEDKRGNIDTQSIEQMIQIYIIHRNQF